MGTEPSEGHRGQDATIGSERFPRDRGRALKQVTRNASMSASQDAVGFEHSAHITKHPTHHRPSSGNEDDRPAKEGGDVFMSTEVVTGTFEADKTNVLA